MQRFTRSPVFRLSINPATGLSRRISWGAALLLSWGVVPTALGSPKDSSTTSFCQIPSSDRDPLQGEKEPGLWGAHSVQHYIRKLLNAPHIKDQVIATYPISYLSMTAERDRERCGGSLAAEDRQSEAIGDLLADLMSRWLVLSTDACGLRPNPAQGQESGLCGAILRTRAQSWDTLRAALEATGVYLSSHMAGALAAVILSDPIWKDFFPRSTHRVAPGPLPASVLEARLLFIQRYKNLFDKNNAFLARRVSVVMKTLDEACYIKGPLLTVGAQGLDRLPFSPLIFGHLRDQTFRTAITVARTLDPSQHPMLAYDSAQGAWVPQSATFKNFVATPRPLLDLEAETRAQLSHQALTWALRPLGSMSQEDLTRLAPSRNARCRYPLL